MSVLTDKTYHYQVIRKTCYAANIAYLIIRLFYLILFLVSKLYILAYITAGTILIYIALFFVFKKKKYYLYALLCGNEFFAYIIVTTLMTGFSTGFCFYLIGLCIVSFFTAYFSKTRNVKGTIVWAGLSLAIFLTMYFVSQYNPPFYEIDKWLELTLFTTHTVGVFVFVVAYLLVFIKYASHLENKITNESRTDELTQISNRYGLYDYFELEDDKSNLYLALFDIDNFKVVNDTYGHIAGDYILKEVARITEETLKDSFVCRYGGEEFIVVLKEDSNDQCFAKLETLRKNIEKETFEFNKIKINLTITIGMVKYHNNISLEKWVGLSDAKMYSGKETGKNKTVI